MSPKFSIRFALVVCLVSLFAPSVASAQLFGGQGLGGQGSGGQGSGGQVDEDPEMRIDKLENQLRALTGQNEELQFRNRQLEEQLRALQGANPGGPPPNQAAQGARPAPVPQQQTYQQPAPYQQPPQGQPNYQGQQGGQPSYSSNATPPYDGGQSAPIAQTPGGGGRRGDAFDPSQNPNAPGAPRALGGGQMPINPNSNPGAPVNLSAPPPAGGYPQQNSASIETAPPSQSPKDEFDLGIGYIQRKDYASAENTMRAFMQKYPSDRLIADAQYWLGESLYQRQRYRDAAESFLAVTTKYEKSNKAPDALLRLGQSLAALKEKDAACAAFGEVTRKYPRASTGVKQGADREQKRVGC